MEQFTTGEQKNNAMIGYCFLAPLMLISHRVEYRDSFVRSHLRYASLLHLGFLITIAILIFSRNFNSLILYDFTWVHVVLFVFFIGLLYLLGTGMNRAIHGLAPRMGVKDLSLKSFKNAVGSEKTVSEGEKSALLLSHIPLLGIYLSAKHRGLFIEGEKFGNWLVVALVLAVMIDPSLTVFIALLIATTLWLVYEGIGTGTDTKITLLGEKLGNGRDVHVFLSSTYGYIASLFLEEKKIPAWQQVADNREKTYTPLTTKLSPRIFLPIIGLIVFARHESDATEAKTLYEGLTISLLFILGIVLGTMILTVLSLFAGIWGYIYASRNLDCSIPVIGEIADLISSLLRWRKKKSVTEVAHFISQK